MAMKESICPACEHHVQWQAVPSAAGVLFKCSNCWYHLDGSHIASLETLAEKLRKLDADRAALIAGAL